MMSIDFFLNGKAVKFRPNENFGDVFDYNCPGNFKEKEWVINGKLNHYIQRATKIQGIIEPGSKIVCQRKGSQPAPVFHQFPNQPARFQPALQPPFGQPQPPFGQPQRPFGQQPSSSFGQQPQGSLRQYLQSEELGKGFKITVSNDGNTVTIEKLNKEQQSPFSNQQKEQCQIQITPLEKKAHPDEQLQIILGNDQLQNKKTLNCQGYKGVSLRWCTGSQTKFEFTIDE